MATKLDSRSSSSSRRVPDGKRVTFDGGKAKADGGRVPLKTKAS